MFDLAQKWFRKAHSLEPTYTCPEMIWDAMPKSGASQMHTHLQASLGSDIYYGNIERTRQGARLYAQLNNGRNYFTDYLSIHQALGLTIPIGDAHIIVHLVGDSLWQRLIDDKSHLCDRHPSKISKLWLWARNWKRVSTKHCISPFEVKTRISTPRKPNSALLAFVDDLQEYSFSFGMFLPPMVRENVLSPSSTWVINDFL